MKTLVKTSVKLLCNSSPSHGCPEVWHDPAAVRSQRVQITDDFGGVAKMSRRQFGVLVHSAKEGELDGYLET